VKRPAVYLIGAGPGDPGLITVRGLHHLRSADVVVYDHLVPARLLKYARQGAELIDVGTAAPQSSTAQDAISYLLLEKAREGKVVARLKWGDPFVFDRGGEEALFLHEHGIPFEVVPGLAAGLAVPAYAGVPVTYPGGGDTITLVRGYEADSISASECSPTIDGSCPEFDRLFGSRILVLNGEMRAPALGLFTGQMKYGPVPVDIVGFFDAGIAWTSTTTPSFGAGRAGDRGWVSSAGVGARFNFFGIIGELDLVHPFQRPTRNLVWVFTFRTGC